MIIPTRLKKITQICADNRNRYALDNVHVRKRNNKTELTATDGRALLRFILGVDANRFEDCETQIYAKDFKRIIGASGTVEHKIVAQPNGVVRFQARNRDGSPGAMVEASSECAGKYPDADTVINKPVFDAHQEEKLNYTTHRLNADLLRKLLDAVVTSGAEHIDLVTAGEMDPVYIDGESTGKHDANTVQFHGIVMPCAKD